MLISCSLLKFPKSLMAFISNLFGGLKRVLVLDSGEGKREVEEIRMSGLETKNGEIAEFENYGEIDLTQTAEIPLISIVKKLEQLKNGYFRDRRQVYIGTLAGLNLDFKEIWNFAQREKMLFQILELNLNLLVDLEIMLIYGVGLRNKKVNILRALHDLRDHLASCYSSFCYYPY